MPGAQPPAEPDWLHEIKHDGYRMLAWRSGDRVRLFTRNGHEWTGRFPLIGTSVFALAARSCIIDGEAIACDGNGLADVELLRGRREDRRVTLCAFDLIELNGRDLRAEPIEVRKGELERLLRGSRPGLALNRVFVGPPVTSCSSTRARSGARAS
jgi:bifunctional non-homologous end joining protein LigD